MIFCGRVNKMVIPVMLICGISIAIFSCKHDRPPAIPCNTPGTLSFKGDILPLFDTYCNASGCHSGTNVGANLNLTDSVAYSQLMKQGTGYIDTQNPNFSGIYTSMTASSNVIMPPSGKIDSCKTLLVLRWIEQGALNN